MTTVLAPPFEIDPALAEVVLALADDELVIGHRHSEWLGLSPFLEEDLAMASIAQDEFGHARSLYALLWPSWTLRDAFVVQRAPSAFRSCALVELDAQPWEQHLLRHVLYDVIEGHRWRSLAAAGIAPLVAIAERAITEERWHRRHATDLLARLAPSQKPRFQAQLDVLAPLVGALMDGLTPEEQQTATDDLIGLLHGLGLELGEISVNAHHRTKRSKSFDEVHRSLGEVMAIDPSATW